MPIHVKTTHPKTSWGGRLHLSMLIQTLKTTITLPGLAWQQITITYSQWADKWQGVADGRRTGAAVR